MADSSTVVVQPLPAVITDTVLIIALVVIGLFFVYLMIREMRLMKTTARQNELELEREKLKLLQQHADAKNYPFTRLSPEQLGAIKTVEDENVVLETGIFAKEKLIDTRLTRLENMVKDKKLDNMMGRISQEEKKVK